MIRKVSDLEQRLRNEEIRKHGSYEKRTEHLRPDGYGVFVNRLIEQDSPYLLQHAHNPVDWYPWGDEAFREAAAQQKVIFLSIGYSTCHWCHVMEVESFDSIEVGELLNQHFISIKLDREQHPDVDEIYMTGVQIISGHGGWPMSNFLCPDGKPIFGATYFRTQEFINLIGKISSAWEEKKTELEEIASEHQISIDKILRTRGEITHFQNLAGKIDELVATSLRSLYSREDRNNGGLIGSPKFPQEPLLLLLVDQAQRFHDSEPMAFLNRALEGMARGGIYDQIGGGFCRYSVDENWLVPHFEKMLYNQSQLGLVFLETYRLTRRFFFKRVLQQTLDYVQKEMEAREGGFYSATDADSEGVEGRFFVWTENELKSNLSAGEFKLVLNLFAPTKAGNFEGANILSLCHPIEVLEKESRDKDFFNRVDKIRNKLYSVREKRIHPLCDKKLIVSWVAAMAETFLKAGFEVNRPDWIMSGRKALDRIWRESLDKNQRLHRISIEGSVSISAQLEDYAQLASGLITEFDVVGDDVSLERAETILRVAVKDFWDDDYGGFFVGPLVRGGPKLIRSKSATDGATISAVGTVVFALQRLAARRFSKKVSFDARYYAESASSFYLGQLEGEPLSHPTLLRAVRALRSSGPDSIQYASDGRCKIAVSGKGVDDGRVIELRIMPASGWHISLPEELSGAATPLSIELREKSGWAIDQIIYPSCHNVISAPDSDLSLRVYDRSFIVVLRLRKVNLEDQPNGFNEVSVQMQLCNEHECLMPTRLDFLV
ncbi:thioredoxin domain-containing protein [OM182 bacterium]|nr:thioredoxin domain-containing protein [OM182 bacterium]